MALPFPRRRPLAAALLLCAAAPAVAQDPLAFPAAPPGPTVPVLQPGESYAEVPPAEYLTPAPGSASEILAAPAAETPPPPPPYGGPLATRPGLTGDWGGVRETLRDNGLTFRGDLTQFYQGNTTGGRGTGFDYGFKANYFFDLDGEKAGLWKGLFVNLRAESRVGESANSKTGALVPTNTAMLFPADGRNVSAITALKVTQALSESFVVFAGKINTVDEDTLGFADGNGTTRFLNGGLVFNFGTVRAVPYSTFGTGFAVLRGGEPVFSVTVFDAVDHPTDFGLDSLFDQGAVVASEARLPTNFFGLPGHYGVGGVYSNRRYTALDTTSYLQLIPSVLAGVGVTAPRETGSWSVYTKMDQTLVRLPGRTDGGIGVFNTLGISDGNPSPVRYFINAGVGGASPLSNRPLDSFGVGYYYLGVSESLKRLVGRRFDLRDEQGVEAFYDIGLTPWMHVTPDVQVIVPARGAADTALLFGLRARIDF